jgi:hypothetical protein
MPGGTRELANSTDMPRIDAIVGNEVLPAINGAGVPIGIPANLFGASTSTAALLARMDTAEDDIEELEAAGQFPSFLPPTWTALAAITGSFSYQRAEVRTDGGTHTDPVVGGTVDNNGIYSWSVSPAGWQRLGDLSDDSIAAEVVEARGEEDTLGDAMEALNHRAINYLTSMGGTSTAYTAVGNPTMSAVSTPTVISFTVGTTNGAAPTSPRSPGRRAQPRSAPRPALRRDFSRLGCGRRRRIPSARMPPLRSE